MTSFAPRRCHNCGQEVRFEKTRHDRWQMLNPNPSFTEGNIVLIGFGPLARTHVLTPAELNDGARRYRFTDHHATCKPLQLEGRDVPILSPGATPLLSGANR